MSAATPAQAAAHAFVTGCVKRGITASQAAVPPEGQLATVRGLWADVAQAGHEAITAQEPHAAPKLAALQADRDRLAELVCRYERITTSWARGMYSAWIDCMRGDVNAAVGCLSEGLDGYDGTEWNRTETGAEWWERTKAEEGL